MREKYVSDFRHPDDLHFRRSIRAELNKAGFDADVDIEECVAQMVAELLAFRMTTNPENRKAADLKNREAYRLNLLHGS